MRLLSFLAYMLLFSVLSIPFGIWMVGSNTGTPEEAVGFSLVGAFVLALVFAIFAPIRIGGCSPRVGMGCMLVLLATVILVSGAATFGQAVPFCFAVVVIPILLLMSYFEGRMGDGDGSKGSNGYE